MQTHTANQESMDTPSPICPIDGVRRDGEYIQSGTYFEDGMEFPVFTCVECKGEVTFD
jgi:hypothetical protein